MKIKNPIYQGRMGAKLEEEEEDLSGENPRVSTLPPPPSQVGRIRRKTGRSVLLQRRSIHIRRTRLHRRPMGAKLEEAEDLSPPSRESASPPSSPTSKALPLVEAASPPALPVPAGDAPDKSDPKMFRRLPRYFFRYRTLPKWMMDGDVAAGKSEAAPSEDKSERL